MIIQPAHPAPITVGKGETTATTVVSLNPVYPPPPVLTEGYNLFHIRSACRRLVQPVSMRTHFFVPTPTHTALQPIRTAHAPRWVTLHRYPSKPAAFSSHLMTAGADAQPSGRKPANMPYAEPLQGSTTCNPEGFFSPLPKRMMNEARTLPAEAERAAAISWTGCQPTEIKNWRAGLAANWRRSKTGARGLPPIGGDQKLARGACRQMAEIKNWRAELAAKWRRSKTGARGLPPNGGDQKLARGAYRQNFSLLQIPADDEHTSSFTNHF